LSNGLLRAFPGLAASNFIVTSPRTPNYNCIAWAAGDEQHWWEPLGLGGYYWPPGIPREYTRDAYILAFRRQGYRECGDASLDDGYEKIALFFDRNGMPTHAARQLPDGNWTSKLGAWEDIQHDRLEAVEGPSYGRASLFMRRKTRSEMPPPQARNVGLMAPEDSDRPRTRKGSKRP
jgi:hypothetical protein